MTGLTAHYERMPAFPISQAKCQHGRTVTGDPTFEEGPVGRAVTFDGDTEVSFGHVGAFDTRDAFSLAVWINGFGKQPMAVLQKLDDRQRGRGYSVRFDDVELAGIQRWAARLEVALSSDSPAGRIEIKSRARVRLGTWHHVALTYSGSGKAAGLELYIDGVRADVEVVRDTLAGSIRTESALRACNRDPEKAFNGQLDDLRLYYCALTAEQVKRGRHPRAGARDPLRRDRQALEGSGAEDSRLLPHACRARDNAQAVRRAEGAADR